MQQRTDELAGKVALITGGSRGIGRATALRLSRAGARVVIVAKGRDALEQVVQQIESEGGQVVAVSADVIQGEQLEAVAEAPRTHFGALDILINNAGGAPWGDVADQPQEQMDWVLGLNLRAVIALTRLCLPPMLERGEGTIINISSLAGIHGSPRLAAYAAAKAGVNAWSQSLWEEVRRRGLKVCAICPGHVDVRDEYPRHGMTADDVAAAVHYVATSSSRVCPTRLVLREQLQPEWAAEDAD